MSKSGIKEGIDQVEEDMQANKPYMQPGYDYKEAFDTIAKLKAALERCDPILDRLEKSFDKGVR